MPPLLVKIMLPGPTGSSLNFCVPRPKTSRSTVLYRASASRHSRSGSPPTPEIGSPSFHDVVELFRADMLVVALHLAGRNRHFVEEDHRSRRARVGTANARGDEMLSGRRASGIGINPVLKSASIMALRYSTRHDVAPACWYQPRWKSSR
jgi:hypothetical protein